MFGGKIHILDAILVEGKDMETLMQTFPVTFLKRSFLEKIKLIFISKSVDFFCCFPLLEIQHL